MWRGTEIEARQMNERTRHLANLVGADSMDDISTVWRLGGFVMAKSRAMQRVMQIIARPRTRSPLGADPLNGKHPQEERPSSLARKKKERKMPNHEPGGPR